MSIGFHWHLGYQDHHAYEVYGAETMKEIEVYRGDAHILAYISSWYNGTKEEFTRSILARQGGVAITYPIHGRWIESEYRDFQQFWRDDHKKVSADMARRRAKYPDPEEAKFFPEPQLKRCPRPIYWNQDLLTYSDEPFHQPACLVTAGICLSCGHVHDSKWLNDIVLTKAASI